MRTRILLGLFAALMLGVSCTTAQKETVMETTFVSDDNSWKTKVSKDTGEQFRLHLTTSNDDLVLWVKLYATERTTSKEATRDIHQVFNTYLVDSQYVYRGTARWNGNYRSALVITAIPLEQIIKRKLGERGSVQNTMFVETSEAYKYPTTEKWGKCFYLNL